MVGFSKKKIAVVTGSRAEYGLLYWLMREIQLDADLELQVIVTGMHLSQEFGLTYKQIEADGFSINVKVESQLSSDTEVGVAKSVGLGVIGFADAYANLKPDMVVLLGDRFEILAAAQAALFAKIPIAHLYGGEVSEGAFDESIRHAITKMSHLHFVGTEPYRQRVIQLGEEPSRVFFVGYTAIDYLSRIKLLDRQELETQLNFKFGKMNFLVVYHPATLGDKNLERGLNELFKALDKFPEANIIFSKTNSDPAGRQFNQMIDRYVEKNSMRVSAYYSLGNIKYMSCVQQVDVVIGNSSSGIIEVPALKKASVNIGIRQRGRLRASSVIDCEEEEMGAIEQAIIKALSYNPATETSDTLYGDGMASVKIKNIIKHYDFEKSLAKRFFDIPQITKI